MREDPDYRDEADAQEDALLDAYDAEDLESETHREAVRRYPHAIEAKFPEHLKKALGEAGYSFSELGLFTDFDGDIKSPELMIQIWAIVQSILRDGDFPADLRM